MMKAVSDMKNVKTLAAMGYGIALRYSSDKAVNDKGVKVK